MLDDPDSAHHLKMLGLIDVKELEKVLRALKRQKVQRGKMMFGSSKFRQKGPGPPDRTREMNRRSMHAVRIPSEGSSSEDSKLDNSGNEDECT